MKRPLIIERRPLAPRNGPRRAGNGALVSEIRLEACRWLPPASDDAAPVSGNIAREVAHAVRINPFRFPQSWVKQS